MGDVLPFFLAFVLDLVEAFVGFSGVFRFDPVFLLKVAGCGTCGACRDLGRIGTDLRTVRGLVPLVVGVTDVVLWPSS